MSGSKKAIDRDHEQLDLLSNVIQQPESADPSAIRDLYRFCIRQVGHVRMGGRSASLMGLCTVLWYYDRETVEVDPERILAVGLRVSIDPSLVQPELGPLLVGVILNKWRSRIDEYDEVRNTSGLFLQSIEDKVVNTSEICVNVARSVLDAMAIDFAHGLEDAVQIVKNSWPQVGVLNEMSDDVLLEKINEMSSRLPAPRSERDRRVYRLYLERSGRWEILQALHLKR